MMIAFRRVLPIAVALVLAGCSSGMSLSSSTGSGSGNADQPSNTQLLTDVPIPSGATLDGERSLILSDRDRWMGRVVMKMGSSAADATAFFQLNMPNYGWQPVMSVTSQTSVLTYTRGDRAATVQIDRASLYGAIVLLTVAPRQAEGGAAGSGTASAYEPAAPRAAPLERVRSEPLGSSRR